MKIRIEGCLPKDFGLTRASLKAVAEYCAARSAARVRAVFQEITLVLQDDASSAEVHQAIMKVPTPTDVITQSYTAIPPEPEGVYGELYLNLDQARRVAPKRAGWSRAKELLLYVAHGLDHLSGADDHSPSDYARMRRRELRWLKHV